MTGVTTGMTVQPRPRAADLAGRIAEAAGDALLSELATYPKPGLVSHVDAGSHDDMDGGSFRAAIAAIAPFFADLARAGAAGAAMADLRRIGLKAEAAMLAATGGVNTHRGAIFGLGLLAAAAGAGAGDAPGSLGAEVRRRWSGGILAGPVPADRPGAVARRRYGAGGAPAEAASGFATLYRVGLPCLDRARARGTGDARVETCMALIAAEGDTNLLHRGGIAGAAFARDAARDFLERGGTARPGWQAAAEDLHRAFVARRLSPGGAADLLSMTLFVDAVERRRA